MEKCVAVGDASDFMTETPRTPIMKKVRNMAWSDKMHHAAARGTSFCSANGMNIMVLPLVFARASETACIRAMWSMLVLLPPFVSIAYDKGIRGMRSLLPNFNFVFMPCFLAPSKGKDKFTAGEAVHNRGVARNRYVVEITYARVKRWHLLKEIIPAENFHLMDATWLWAMGFSNLCHECLQPPPDVETPAQRSRRESRNTSERAAAAVDQAALREAAAAAAGVRAAMEVDN